MSLFLLGLAGVGCGSKTLPQSDPAGPLPAQTRSPRQGRRGPAQPPGRRYRRAPECRRERGTTALAAGRFGGFRSIHFAYRAHYIVIREAIGRYTLVYRSWTGGALRSPENDRDAGTGVCPGEPRSFRNASVISSPLTASQGHWRARLSPYGGLNRAGNSGDSLSRVTRPAPSTRFGERIPLQPRPAVSVRLSARQAPGSGRSSEVTRAIAAPILCAAASNTLSAKWA